MDERLSRAESRISEVEARLAALEQQLAARALPAQQVETPVLPAGAAPAAADLPSLEGLPSFAGRSCLFLGGAYLLRFATERGMISMPVGLAIGILYALSALVAADRAGAAGQKASAFFHVVTSALIVMPLLFEGTARLAVVPAPLAAAVLFLVSAAGALISIRRDLPAAVSILHGFVLATAAVLMFASHRPTPFAVLLLALAAGSLFLAGARGWTGLALSTALVVDLAVLTLVFLSRGGGSRVDWLAATPVAGIQMALAAVYFGSFGLFLVGSDFAAGPVTWIQSAAAFLVGFEAARPHFEGKSWPGLFAVAVGLASAVVAWRLEKAGRPMTSFAWAAVFGTLFLLEGSRMLLATGPAAMVWGMVVLAVALAATGRRRPLLAPSAALLALASFALAGGFALGLHGFLARAETGWPRLLPWLAGVGILLALSAVRLARTGEGEGWLESPPRLLVSAIGLAALGTSIVHFLAVPNDAAAPVEGTLAVVRTATLAIAAILLAALHRRTGWPEARRLVTLVLVGLGIKLVVDELRLGQAGVVVAGLGLYGIALLVAPRLSRRPIVPPAAA